MKIDILVLFQKFYYPVSGYLCPGQDGQFQEGFDSLKVVIKELIFGLYYSEYVLDKMVIPKGIFGIIKFAICAWFLGFYYSECYGH